MLRFAAVRPAKSNKDGYRGGFYSSGVPGWAAVDLAVNFLTNIRYGQ